MNIGSVIDGAFRLVRDHPAAIAIWALAYLAITIGSFFIMRPFADMEAVRVGAISPLAMIGPFILFPLATFILYVVLMTAAQRSVLRPEERGLAYLQLGMDELRMIGLSLLLIIGFYFGFLIAAIILAMIAVSLRAAMGVGGATMFGIIAVLLLVGTIIWLEVRLSLAFPLTLLRRKIIIGESWRLTRGRFWTLFGAYLVILLIVILISIAAGLATAGSYFADLIRNVGNPQGIEQAMQAQMAQLSDITTLTVIGWVLSAAAGAIAIALMGGAVATAAQTLIGNEDSIADTFA